MAGIGGNTSYTRGQPQNPHGLNLRNQGGVGRGNTDVNRGVSGGAYRSGRTPSANPVIGKWGGGGGYGAAAGSAAAGGAGGTPSPTGATPYDPAAAAAATAASGAQARGAAEAAAAPVPPPDVSPGSQSGPGILENWFNQRAQGIDAGYEYGMRRGGDAIDTRMAAGGSFNSGARGQQLSDFAANMGAQRQSQLDSLAAGASGEHLGRLGLMFNQGLGLAGGQAGLASAYDLGAAGNMDAATRAQMQMALGQAGIDSQTNQGRVNNLLSIWGLAKAGNSGS